MDDNEEEPPEAQAWRRAWERKYGLGKPTPPIPPTVLDRMTPRHVKALATLVRKYGVPAVVEAAGMVAPSSRKRGRPRFKMGGAYYEWMALAQLFDELVEEHRAGGSRYPKKAAMRKLFAIAYPSRSGDPDAFRRFEFTTKRKLPQGRRDLKAALERAAAIEHYRQSRKKPSKKTRE